MKPRVKKAAASTNRAKPTKAAKKKTAKAPTREVAAGTIADTEVTPSLEECRVLYLDLHNAVADFVRTAWFDVLDCRLQELSADINQARTAFESLRDEDCSEIIRFLEHLEETADDAVEKTMSEGDAEDVINLFRNIRWPKHPDMPTPPGNLDELGAELHRQLSQLKP